VDYRVCEYELERGESVGEGACGGVCEGKLCVFGYIGVGGEVCLVWAYEGLWDGGEVGGYVGWGGEVDRVG